MSCFRTSAVKVNTTEGLYEIIWVTENKVKRDSNAKLCTIAQGCVVRKRSADPLYLGVWAVWVRNAVPLINDECIVWVIRSGRSCVQLYSWAVNLCNQPRTALYAPGPTHVHQTRETRQADKHFTYNLSDSTIQSLSFTCQEVFLICWWRWCM